MVPSVMSLFSSLAPKNPVDMPHLVFELLSRRLDTNHLNSLGEADLKFQIFSFFQSSRFGDE